MKHLVGVLFFALALMIPGAMLYSRNRQAPMPDYGTTPDFSLTNQDGETVTRTSLEGAVTVVNFIFTRCPSVCPTLTRQMASVQQQLPDTVRTTPIEFVSISVDPQNDTPAVLGDFARKFGADTANWDFLTGEQSAIDEVVAGYKQTARRIYDKDGDYDVVHGQNFTLLDRQGHIRGFYSSAPEDLPVLVRDTRRLADTR